MVAIPSALQAIFDDLYPHHQEPDSKESQEASRLLTAGNVTPSIGPTMDPVHLTSGFELPIP